MEEILLGTRGGVGGWCGESLRIDLQTKMGWRKLAEAATSGASAWAPFRGYARRI
jgi:hypothetical protein